MSDPGETPKVSDLKVSTDGTGLRITRWFSTWDTDSTNESFLPNAFDAALPNFLKLNPVALYNHDKSMPPVGIVESCEVKPRGLWGTIVMPRPEAGSKAAEIYAAVKNGLLSSFSVGGLWDRHYIGGKTKLMCKRLLEISLVPQPANQFAAATAVTSVEGVKSLQGRWVSDGDLAWLDEQAAIRRARQRLEVIDLMLTNAAIQRH